MPISTTLKRRSASARSCAITRTWAAISPAVRFRSSPIRPVRQKPQRMAQPTCVDTQKVIAGVSGMKTVSTSRPSSNRIRNLTVPSADSLRADTVGVRIANVRSSCARRSVGRSVMRAKSTTPRR